ncbi:hypothetical protein PXH67_43265 (plasmid) [Streptomyces sp. P8-A8]|uniref:hypothetical protein n=1 Tax=Streptomyces sp. P8-A8 TaxID=3029759 RepID=UPI0036DBF489
MTQPSPALDDRTQVLIAHRRRVAELKRDISRMRRGTFAGVFSLTCAGVLLVTLITITIRTYGQQDMGLANFLGFIVVCLLALELVTRSCWRAAAGRGKGASSSGR